MEMLFLTLGRDMYSVIQYSPLLPPNQEKPASYPDGETLTLDRDSTVDDICDFIVEYINSDVLVCSTYTFGGQAISSRSQGLLSDRLLIIAGELFAVVSHYYKSSSLRVC
jgi:RNA-dependent RNA polymerase